MQSNVIRTGNSRYILDVINIDNTYVKARSVFPSINTFIELSLKLA